MERRGIHLVRYMVVLALCGKKNVLEALAYYFSGDLSLSEAARIANVSRGSFRNYVSKMVAAAMGRRRAESLASRVARVVLEVVPTVAEGNRCGICGAQCRNICSHVTSKHRDVVEKWVDEVLKRL